MIMLSIFSILQFLYILISYFQYFVSRFSPSHTKHNGKNCYKYFSVGFNAIQGNRKKESKTHIPML